jgi:N-acetyl-anhydromuramyl-L-alanine amidase AmpD
MWTWIKRLFGSKSATGPQPASPNSPSVSTTVSTSAPITLAKAYDVRTLSTPNKSPNTITPMAVVLHHTAGSYAGSVSWCMNPGSKVSYHVIIARNGRRTILADDRFRTWHAGRSVWQGRPDLNSWSLGLAWEGDTYTDPLGEDAMASALEYLVPRMHKWAIPLNMVLTHGQVSPGRKTDIAPGDAARFKSRLKAALN